MACVLVTWYFILLCAVAGERGHEEVRFHRHLQKESRAVNVKVKFVFGGIENLEKTWSLEEGTTLQQVKEKADAEIGPNFAINIIVENHLTGWHPDDDTSQEVVYPNTLYYQRKLTWDHNAKLWLIEEDFINKLQETTIGHLESKTLSILTWPAAIIQVDEVHLTKENRMEQCGANTFTVPTWIASRVLLEKIENVVKQQCQLHVPTGFLDKVMQTPDGVEFASGQQSLNLEAGKTYTVTAHWSAEPKDFSIYIGGTDQPLFDRFKMDSHKKVSELKEVVEKYFPQFEQVQKDKTINVEPPCELTNDQAQLSQVCSGETVHKITINRLLDAPSLACLRLGGRLETSAKDHARKSIELLASALAGYSEHLTFPGRDQEEAVVEAVSLRQKEENEIQIAKQALVQLRGLDDDSNTILCTDFFSVLSQSGFVGPVLEGFRNPAVGFLNPHVQDVIPHKGVEWPEDHRDQITADTNKGRQMVGDAMAILSLSGLTHDRHIGMPAIAKKVEGAVRYYFNPTNWIEDLSMIYDQLEIIYVGLMKVDYRYVGREGLCDSSKPENSLRAAYIHASVEGVYYHGVSGNPIVHLCAKFFEHGDHERQDTLIHEISHHKPEPTVDSAYGDGDVARLASTAPTSAMGNADTYALFVRRLTEIAAKCGGSAR